MGSAVNSVMIFGVPCFNFISPVRMVITLMRFLIGSTSQTKILLYRLLMNPYSPNRNPLVFLIIAVFTKEESAN